MAERQRQFLERREALHAAEQEQAKAAKKFALASQQALELELQLAARRDERAGAPEIRPRLLRHDAVIRELERKTLEAQRQRAEAAKDVASRDQENARRRLELYQAQRRRRAGSSSSVPVAGSAGVRGACASRRMPLRDYGRDRMTHHFGIHAVDTGGIDMAARRSAGAGGTALQIFTAIPKYYGDKSSIRPERVAALPRGARRDGHRAGARDRARRLRAQHRDVGRGEVGPRGRGARQGARALDRARRRAASASIPAPPRTATAWRAVEPRGAAMTQRARARCRRDTRLLVENTAGAGTTIGRTPGRGRAPSWPRPGSAPRRAPATGSTPATCSRPGTTSPSRRRRSARILDEFEAAAGEPPSFFHLNDSEGALGSNKDRHMLIGEGKIGAEPFGWLLHDRAERRRPADPGDAAGAAPRSPEDDPTPDPWDVRMIALLSELSAALNLGSSLRCRARKRLVQRGVGVVAQLADAVAAESEHHAGPLIHDVLGRGAQPAPLADLDDDPLVRLVPVPPHVLVPPVGRAQAGLAVGHRAKHGLAARAIRRRSADRPPPSTPRRR